MTHEMLPTFGYKGDSLRLFPKIAPIRSDFFSILNFTYVDTPYK
jgi:hypothetical protein